MCRALLCRPRGTSKLSLGSAAAVPVLGLVAAGRSMRRATAEVEEPVFDPRKEPGALRTGQKLIVFCTFITLNSRIKLVIIVTYSHLVYLLHLVFLPPEQQTRCAPAGVTLPMKYFDPLGFAKEGDREGFYQLRAAELKHGRIAVASGGAGRQRMRP